MTKSASIQKALATVQLGGTLLYPTDTIWGIGCDATNEDAVGKVYTIKQRATSKNLISLVSSIEMLEALVGNLPVQVKEKLNSPQPTTIIYPEVKHLAKNAIAEDGSAAIRLVHSGWVRDFIEVLGRPLISTSANISGENFDGQYDDVSSAIKDNVDFIVPKKFDFSEHKRASTILKLNDDNTFQQIR